MSNVDKFASKDKEFLINWIIQNMSIPELITALKNITGREYKELDFVNESRETSINSTITSQSYEDLMLYLIDKTKNIPGIIITAVFPSNIGPAGAIPKSNNMDKPLFNKFMGMTNFNLVIFVKVAVNGVCKRGLRIVTYEILEEMMNKKEFKSEPKGKLITPEHILHAIIDTFENHKKIDDSFPEWKDVYGRYMVPYFEIDNKYENVQMIEQKYKGDKYKKNIDNYNEYYTRSNELLKILKDRVCAPIGVNMFSEKPIIVLKINGKKELAAMAIKDVAEINKECPTATDDNKFEINDPTKMFNYADSNGIPFYQRMDYTNYSNANITGDAKEDYRLYNRGDYQYIRNKEYKGNIPKNIFNIPKSKKTVNDGLVFSTASPIRNNTGRKGINMYTSINNPFISDKMDKNYNKCVMATQREINNIMDKKGLKNGFGKHYEGLKQLQNYYNNRNLTISALRFGNSRNDDEALIFTNFGKYGWKRVNSLDKFINFGNYNNFSESFIRNITNKMTEINDYIFSEYRKRELKHSFGSSQMNKTYKIGDLSNNNLIRFVKPSESLKFKQQTLKNNSGLKSLSCFGRMSLPGTIRDTGVITNQDLSIPTSQQSFLNLCSYRDYLENYQYRQK